MVEHINVHPTVKRSRKPTGVREQAKRSKVGHVSSSSSSSSSSHSNTSNGHSIWQPPSVALSSRDKASQLKLSQDQLTCYGVHGGFRMARGTHGVHNGAYYWEIDVKGGQDSNAHYRIGWSTRQGELQAPVGYDKYSYAYRDIQGSKVHTGIRDDTYGECYGPGDVIGCFLYLDDVDPQANQMRFFKNGKDQGVAYKGTEIPSGVYFPAVSIYMLGELTVNFGPSFILKHDIYGANAVSEVQPMSPEDRKVHEFRIAAVRAAREQATLPVGLSGSSVHNTSVNTSSSSSATNATATATATTTSNSNNSNSSTGEIGTKNNDNTDSISSTIAGDSQVEQL